MPKLVKYDPDKLVKACGSKIRALFFITWLKHNRNAKEAYKELHPEVDDRTATVLGSRMLTKVDLTLVMSAYNLGFEKYMSVLNDGLEAKKIHGTDDNFVEIPDHAVREKYLTKLGNLLGLETKNMTNIQVNVAPILGGKSTNDQSLQE